MALAQLLVAGLELLISILGPHLASSEPLWPLKTASCCDFDSHIAKNRLQPASRASQNVPNPWISHAFLVCVFDAYRMLLQDAYNIANPQKYQKTLGKTMVFHGFPRIGHIKQT